MNKIFQGTLLKETSLEKGILASLTHQLLLVFILSKSLVQFSYLEVILLFDGLSAPKLLSLRLVTQSGMQSGNF